MGKPQILEKLTDKLKCVPGSESDVVYILSRIRKILELGNYPEKYSTLLFYCNLALHSTIDRFSKSVNEMLLKVKDGGLNPEAYQNSIIGYNDLHKQLSNFLKENNLPDAIYTEEYGVKTFNELLNNIYSETKIILTVKEKFEITVDEKGGLLIKPGKINL